MIRLSPSRGIVKATGIDFELLSFIIGKFIPITKKITLQVHKARNGYSYFCDYDNLIAIDIASNKSLRETIKTILHELRHYIQTKHFKIKFTDYDDNYNAYYRSPEEIDARSYEKLAKEVCSIYKSYVALFKKIEDLKLNCFNNN